MIKCTLNVKVLEPVPRQHVSKLLTVEDALKKLDEIAQDCPTTVGRARRFVKEFLSNGGEIDAIQSEDDGAIIIDCDQGHFYFCVEILEHGYQYSSHIGMGVGGIRGSGQNAQWLASLYKLYKLASQ